MSSLNSRDLFLNLRRLVKMTKPLRFENKSLRLKYKCLICIWIIFWAILDLFINPKYLFKNKSFSQTYYFKSEKSFVILTSLLGLKINPGNLESLRAKWTPFPYVHLCYLKLTKGQTRMVGRPDLAHGPPSEKAWSKMCYLWCTSQLKLTPNIQLLKFII